MKNLGTDGHLRNLRKSLFTGIRGEQHDDALVIPHRVIVVTADVPQKGLGVTGELQIG